MGPEEVSRVLRRLAGKGRADGRPSPSPGLTPREQRVLLEAADLIERAYARPSVAAEGRCLTVSIDGASRGNPGPAGAGVLIQEEGGSFEREVWEYIGDATNNVAEYRALLLALREAASLKPASVRIRSDSQLLVRQLAGDYRVKHPHLIDLHARARELIKAFPVVQVEHVRRDANARADRLANRAIDEALAAKRAGEEHSSGEAGDRGADA